MKVLHVIPDIYLKSGGPSFAISGMILNLQKMGIETHLATSASDEKLKTIDTYPFSANSVHIFKAFKLLKGHQLPWQLTLWLIFNIRRFDVIHVHTYFNLTQLVACFLARWNRIPVILRPAGIMSSWDIINGYLLKRLWIKLLDRKNLKYVSYVHATSEMEHEDLKQIFDNKKIVVIPHGVDLPILPVDHKSKGSKFNLLYMSRIHPRKRLDLVIDALADLVAEIPELMLNVLGEADNASIEYLNKIKTDISKYKIGQFINFKGHLFGEEKKNILLNTHVFILLSDGENFANSAAEAMSYEIPVILSAKVAVSKEVREFNAGWIIESGNKLQVISSIREACRNDFILKEYSKNARVCAQESFSWSTHCKKIVNVYKKLLEN